ncbi:phage holin family protein [Musicola keenii]|uniref:phage holin family protein n=1 Tax=Musicola keenii TaxID=2884250 RepID=UPI001784BC8A|nr:phage holin family protein [Musicola keenii]
MTEPQRQGPASAAIGSLQRILSLLVGIVETRVRLAVVELEQEKILLVQLLLMVGLTLLLATLGLISLVALIIWSLDPAWRLVALGGITAAFLMLALIIGGWTIVRVRRSTLLQATRNELAADRSLLENKPE